MKARGRIQHYLRQQAADYQPTGHAGRPHSCYELCQSFRHDVPGHDCIHHDAVCRQIDAAVRMKPIVPAFEH